MEMKFPFNKFEEKESFKHKIAKNLLAEWLSEVDKRDDFCKFANWSWRSNYGVYTELKFYETSDPYYFECSAGLTHDDSGIRGDADSWFDKTIDRGKILFVPDITIFHKGTAVILIEVVHTHPVSIEKIMKIESFFSYVELYEIEADEILRQTKKPTEYLRVTKLI